LYLVAEAAKVSDQPVGTLADCLRVESLAVLFVCHTLVEDLPCDAAKPMGHRPDGFAVPAPRRQSSIQNLKHAAFGFHGRVGSLIQNAPHMPVAFG
jgi:hypothetical protein